MVKDLFEVAIVFTKDGERDTWQRNYWADDRGNACKKGTEEFRRTYDLGSVRIIDIDAKRVMGQIVYLIFLNGRRLSAVFDLLNKKTERLHLGERSTLDLKSNTLIIISQHRK